MNITSIDLEKTDADVEIIIILISLSEMIFKLILFVNIIGL